MKIVSKPDAMQRVSSRLRRSQKIGFVPTMGALHAGHLSLIGRALRENKIVIVSIFVNPLQFGPSEDFAHYPRTLASDQKKLKALGVHYLFKPSAKSMYPKGFQTTVCLNGPSSLTKVLEGHSRPGHFAGVTTVVHKLLQIVRPHQLYLGAKDYQQAVVIDRMIRDLHLAVTLHLVPTVRESDGLALSSRNRYLGVRDRQRALALPTVLFWLRNELIGGRRGLKALKKQGKTWLKSEVKRVEYLEIVDPETLEILTRRQTRMTILGACKVGKTRLIDSVVL